MLSQMRQCGKSNDLSPCTGHSVFYIAWQYCHDVGKKPKRNLFKHMIFLLLHTYNVATCDYWPHTRYVKLRVVHAPGVPGTFSPPPASKETAC